MTKLQSEDELLLPAQAQVRYGLDASRIRRLLNEGKLKGEHVGEGRRGIWRVYDSSIKEWVADHPPGKRGRPRKQSNSDQS